MFVYSVKSNHIKVILLTAFLLVTVVSLAVLSRDSRQTSSDGTLVLTAASHEERMSFLSQFGWKVIEEPAEVVEIIIPEEFDETYTAYNQLQINQGFDLAEHKGKRVKRWTYTITNYKGYEDKSCVRANILVCDGVVIGGDVCSTELEGFMHGFYGSQ